MAPTLHRGSDLPPGSVRLLAEAMAAHDPRLRLAGWLRALHLAWVVGGLDRRQVRVVVARDEDALVGVAVAVRYDARPGPRRLLGVAAGALLAGMLLELAQVLLGPSVLVLAAVLGLAAAVAAVLLDGRDGLRGAAEARRRAEAVGRDRAWGRGVIAVHAGHRGRGIGSSTTRALVDELPPGHHWLPVGLTPRATVLYLRLGATPIGGAASELVRRPGPALVRAA